MRTDRRRMLAGAAGLAAVAATGGRTQDKPRRTILAPEVDRLEVLTITDGAVFSFAEPERRPDLTVTRAPRGLPDPNDRFLAEWGLALLIRSWRGDRTRTVLMDFGYSPETLANNMRLLAVDPKSIDAAVVSHGHLDHFGGLEAVLGPSGLRPGTPLRVGGEEAFCARDRMGGPSPLPFGALDRRAIQASGLVIEQASEPRLLADHGFTTGRIPFVSDERPITPTRMSPGVGCERAGLDPDKRDLQHVQDDSVHELGAAWNVRGKGLVVIGACSHRGILNTIRQAQAASGIERLHAVMGGFHLVLPQTPAQAWDTTRQMAAMDPDYVIPGHCAGETFITAAAELMPDKLIRSWVGSQFRFGDQG